MLYYSDFVCNYILMYCCFKYYLFWHIHKYDVITYICNILRKSDVLRKCFRILSRCYTFLMYKYASSIDATYLMEYNFTHGVAQIWCITILHNKDITILMVCKQYKLRMIKMMLVITIQMDYTKFCLHYHKSDGIEVIILILNLNILIITI